MGAGKPVSSYVEHLPAILQQGPLIGRFLLAFEAILSGGGPSPDDPSTPVPEGIEQILDRIHTYFDPTTTPEDFLPWLAQWVAASLRDDWSTETKRAFLARCVPLYRKRGTRSGLEEVLRLCVGAVDVIEPDKQSLGVYPIPFTLGDQPSQMGAFDEQQPLHHFLVILRVAERDPVRLARTVRQVREIIDREKPAHTFYSLRLEYPAMKITDVRTDSDKGVIVGETTVLGNVVANTKL